MDNKKNIKSLELKNKKLTAHGWKIRKEQKMKPQGRGKPKSSG